MDDEQRLEKNARIKATLHATKQRRRSMVCQVRDLKIVSNRLNLIQQEQLSRVLLEAKWLRNAIVGAGRFDSQFLKELGNKVPVVVPEINGEPSYVEEREMTVLGGQIRQAVLSEVNNNRKALAALKEKGHTVGKLGFVSRVSSLNLKQYGSTHKVNWKRQRVKVANVSGWLRVRGLDQLSDSCEFANAKLVSRPDGYHLLVTTYTTPEEATGRATQPFQPGTMVGIDMGVATHLTLSDGTKINAQFEETERLRRLRAKLARQTKDSANYRKTKVLIRKEAAKISRRKDDAANKIVHELLRNEHVYMQDEQLASWKRRDTTTTGGKQLQASVLGRVKKLLSDHPRVTTLGQWEATTATCVCGVKTPHTTSQRVFTCPACGYTANRDIHAAENMIRLAQASVRPGQTVMPAINTACHTAHMAFPPVLTVSKPR